MFLKPDAAGIIPRAGYRMGDRQSIKGLQWLAYMGRTRKIIHAGNGKEMHLPGVPNVKVDGYCQETKEVFEYLGCFWHGCLCMPNRHKPIGNTEETLENRYEETMASLKKPKTLVTLLFRSGGVSLENYCVTLLALKMNFARTPM